MKPRRNARGFTLVELPAVSKRNRAAFTLVELLVVIGIIAVLISLLLPALSKARQQAYSSQCLSNLRSIGQAAQIYAAENKGWFPPGHASNFNVGISRTDACFVDYGPTDAYGNPNPNRWIVSEAMARYAGSKFKPYDATKTWAQNVADGYVAPRTPVFYCPTYNQLVTGSGNEPFADNNLLNHDPTANGGNGNAQTKMTYLWVANPWHNMSAATVKAVGDNGGEDMLAANVAAPGNGNGGFCHMDVDPDQVNFVDFDTSRPCKPGYDYLRRTGDKRAGEVAICVDNARQQGSGFFFYPHGSMTGWSTKAFPGPKNAGGGPYKLTIAPKAWFNELFGDGHAESRRGDQLRFRWASTNPQVW